MRNFAEQIFFGASIELISLVLSYIFKEKPRSAITIFAMGTIVAGFVAFSPNSFLLTTEPDSPFIKVIEITATKSFLPTQTQISNSTPTLQVTQTIESQINNWSGILSVRMPTLNEIRTEIPVSLWDANILNVRDMHEPGIDTYTGEAQHGQEYLFPVYWCTTTSELLTHNIDYIDTVFLVNGEIVPEKYVFNYNYDTNTGWKCNYHAIVISGWAKNENYILEIKRNFLKDLSDGQSSYSAGEYIYKLTLKSR